MTIDHELHTVGVREARDNLRTIVQQVGQGARVGIMTHSQPVAVLLGVDEAEHWRRVEYGLSALHGLEIYPELAPDTTELAALIRREVGASHAALRRLARRRREILASTRFIGLTELRLELGAALKWTAAGRLQTVVSYGDPRAVLISFREYQRLADLARIIVWFEAAGLDLATADPNAVVQWVSDFRARTT